MHCFGSSSSCGDVVNMSVCRGPRFCFCFLLMSCCGHHHPFWYSQTSLRILLASIFITLQARLDRLNASLLYREAAAAIEKLVIEHQHLPEAQTLIDVAQCYIAEAKKLSPMHQTAGRHPPRYAPAQGHRQHQQQQHVSPTNGGTSPPPPPPQQQQALHHPEARSPEVARKLQRLKRRGLSTHEEAMDKYKEGRFFEARKLFEQAAELFLELLSTLPPEDIARQIEAKQLAGAAIASAEKLKANSSSDGQLTPEQEAVSTHRQRQHKQQQQQHHLNTKPSSSGRSSGVGSASVSPTPGAASTRSAGSGGSSGSGSGSGSARQQKYRPPVPTHKGVDGGSITRQELEVLKATSTVNRKLYLPFVDADEHENLYGLGRFTDPEGKLALSPKQKGATWARPEEFAHSPTIVTEGMSKVVQTVVSDCSFVSSLAVAADFERKFAMPLVTNLIYPQDKHGKPVYNKYGKYVVKLHFNGCWRKVVIDDFFPRDRRGLLCSYAKDERELWISLLEKAYMKVMGGYDFPGSNSSVDLNALTGWIPERVKVKECDDERWTELWQGLHKGHALITVATGEMSDLEATHAGLVPTHAYAVLDMRDVKGTKLLKLKNPWSHLRWRGRFSPTNTSSWTPELRRSLNYNPEAAAKADDGEFWIDWESVRNFYDVMYINWNPGLYQYRKPIHHCWQQRVGPVKDLYNMQYNPQYRLTTNFAQPQRVLLVLSRHITEISDFANNEKFITLHVYSNGERVFFPTDPLHRGTKINSPHYLVKLDVPAGKQSYSVVVSQYEKSSTINFTVKAFASEDFDFVEMPNQYPAEYKITHQWVPRTAGGSTNDPVSHTKNPQYIFTAPGSSSDRVPVLVKLEVPKEFACGLDISAPGVDEIKTTTYRSGFNYITFVAEGGKVYTVIPSTFNKGETCPFFLTICSATRIILSTPKK
eukprot:m.191191 g.191191  ORF g.191191 m.191191 type:complete len:931 (-) comp14835_c1_seq5:97-2889(-)